MSERSVLESLLQKISSIDRTDFQKPFYQIGLTSLDLVTFAEELRAQGYPVQDSFFIGVGSVSAAIEELLASQESQTLPKLGGAVQSPILNVLGYSFRFPGARNRHTLWHNLLAKVHSVTQVTHLLHGWNGVESPIRWGGVCCDHETFDHRFFNISPSEASVMDPQHRWVLEEIWSCMEDSALSVTEIQGRQVSVFVGVSKNDYAEIMRAQGGQLNPFVSTGTVHSIIANRVSYFLDLRGNSLSLDTACSSALVAVSLAFNDCAGGAEMSFVAGVNALLSTTMFLTHSKAGMLSPRGRCATFDASADGYVRSEGCAAVLLKPASNAEPSFSLSILATQIEHGGKAAGLTVPRTASQVATIRKAVARCPPGTDSPSYIECHGTGTPLGDPIEFSALASALPQKKRRGVILNSVKTNLGHLESCSGLAGLLRVAVCSEMEEIPPILHFSRLNVDIPMAGSNFILPNESISWGEPERIMGTSSFGMGGVNGHAILAGSTKTRNQLLSNDAAELVLCISAETDQLDQYIDRFAQYLMEEPMHPLQTVVGSMNCRKKFNSLRLCSGSTRKELAKNLFHDSAGSAVLDLSKLDERSHRETSEVVHSIAYPFRQSRCWFSLGKEMKRLSTGRVSSLSICFEASQFFLRDHVVGGSILLPGVMYVEIARQACVLAKVDVVGFANIGWHSRSSPSDGLLQMEIRFVPLSEKLHMFVESTLVFSCTILSEHQEQKAGAERKHEKMGTLPLDRKTIYECLSAHGLAYGPTFQTMDSFSSCPSGATSVSRGATFAGDILLHPSVLDCAFQTCVMHHITQHQNGSVRFLPFAAQKVRWFADHSFPLHCLIEVWDRSKEGQDFLEYDISIRSVETGVVVLDVQGFCRRADHQPEDHGLPSFYKIEWIRADELLSSEDYFSQQGSLLLSWEDQSQSLFQELAGRLFREVIPISGGWGTLTACRDVFERLPDLESVRMILCVRKTGQSCLEMLYLAQTLLALHHNCDIVFLSDSSGLALCYDSMIGGFARTLSFEAPSLSLRMVWTDNFSHSAVEKLVQIEVQSTSLPFMEVKYVSGVRYVRELRPASFQLPSRNANIGGALIRESGWYLISGGAGGLGLIFANFVASLQRCNLVLLGRKPANLLSTSLDTLRDSCESLIYESVDVTDMSVLQQRIPVSVVAKLNGVIHAAGVLRDGFILTKSEEDWQAVVAPKVLGSLNLDSLTSNSPLDFFVTCSSIAAWLPNQGQASYAAGNSFLDAFASWRREAGRTGSSISLGWSLWRSGGMSVTQEEEKHLRDAFGIAPLETKEALIAFEVLLRHGIAHPAEFHHAIIASAQAKVRVPTKVATSTQGEASATSKRTSTIAEESLERILVDILEGELMLRPGELGLETPFASLGLTSMVISGLNSRLEEKLGSISKTLFFEYPNLHELLQSFAKARRRKRATGTSSHASQVTTSTNSQITTLLTLHSRANLSSTCVMKPTDPWVDGFFIDRRPAVPGGVFLEFALEAARAFFLKPFTGIRDSFWPRPMFMESSPMEISFVGEAYRVTSNNGEELHASGTCIEGESLNDDASSLEKSANSLRDVSPICMFKSLQFYSLIDTNADLHLEGSFRLVEECKILDERTALVKYSLPLGMEMEFFLHPVIVTGVEQSLLVFTTYLYKDLLPSMKLMPVAIEEVQFATAGARNGWIVVHSLTRPTALNQVHKFDAEVFDNNFKLTMVVRGNAMRILTMPAPAPLTATTMTTGSTARDSRPVFLRSTAVRMAMAWSKDALAAALSEGVLISQVPSDRWDWKLHEDVPKWGCFFTGLPLFDANAFSISPKEAIVMDPQHRMALECSLEVVAASGLDARKMPQNVGVYIGLGKSEYASRASALGIQSAHFETGMWNSGCSGRISYWLNLQGRCLSIDTACSSSLVALVLACEEIRVGREAASIAGGTNSICYVGASRNYTLAGMLSPDGRCKTFDASANGYVRGEGCVLYCLGDNSSGSLARLLGGAVNQDGRSAGLTAPSGTSQQSLFHAALKDGVLFKSEVYALETHGTGTPLGDPIETNSIVGCFSENRKTPLILSSVKSSIGHLETSAGAAGVLKVLIDFDWSKTITTQRCFWQLNPQISQLPEAIGVIPNEEIFFPEFSSRVAGVNSFGFTGTNSQVLLQNRSALYDLKQEVLPFLPPKGHYDIFQPFLSLESFSGDVSLLFSSHHHMAPQRGAAMGAKSAVQTSIRKTSLHFYCSPLWRTHHLRSQLFRECDYQVPLTETLLRRGWTTARGSFHAGVAFGTTLAKWGSIAKVSGLAAAVAILQPHCEDVPSGECLLFVSSGRSPIIRGSCIMFYASGARRGRHSCSLKQAFVGRDVAIKNHSTTVSFSRKAFWLEQGNNSTRSQSDPLGVQVSLDDGSTRFEVDDQGLSLVYLVKDHLVYGVQVMPAAAHIVMVAAQKGKISNDSKILSLENVEIREAFVVSQGCTLHFLHRRNGSFESTSSANIGRRTHVSGSCRATSNQTQKTYLGKEKTSLLWENVEQSTWNALGGLSLAMSFRWLKRFAASDSASLVAQLSPPSEWRLASYVSIPVELLDSIFQTSILFRSVSGDSVWNGFFMAPVVVDSLVLSGKYAGGTLQCQSHLARLEKRSLTMDAVCGIHSEVFIEVRGFVSMQASKEAVFRNSEFAGHNYLYTLVWKQADVPPSSTTVSFSRVNVVGTPLTWEGELQRTLCNLNTASSRTLLIVGFGLFASATALKMCFHACRECTADELLILTRFAFAGNPWGQSIWSMGRAIRRERANCLNLLDVDTISASSSVCEEISSRFSSGTEVRLCVDSKVRLVPVLSPAIKARDKQCLTVASLTWVITGGLGGLSQLVALWLEQEKCSNIILIARSTATVATERVSSLPQCFAAANVSAIEDCCGMLSTVQGLVSSAIAGVFHLAAVLRDGIVQKLVWRDFKDSMSPKIAILSSMSRVLGRDVQWIFFSSIASLLGTAGQSNYAAANGFLDGFALGRSHICSIQWGPWEELGMYAKLAKPLRKWEAIPIETGRELISTIFKSGENIVAAMHPSIIGTEMTRALQAKSESVQQQAAALTITALEAARTNHLSAVELRLAVTEVLKEALGINQQEQLDETADLADLGMDSMIRVDLRRMLSEKIGLDISPAYLFDYPTLERLVAKLSEDVASTQHGNVSPEQGKSAPQPRELSQAPTTTALFVCGVGVRLGSARSLPQFLKLLRSGACKASLRETLPSVTGPPCEGFISPFDPFFFQILPAAAALMTPMEKTLLECSWEALESSGADPFNCHPETAVEIGMATGETMGPAGRIAYFFDFVAPVGLVDTACSSTLLAIANARRLIFSGEATAALAGGVNVLVPQTVNKLFALRLLSNQGRCMPFDRNADGYLPAEGCVMYSLNPTTLPGHNVMARIINVRTGSNGRNSSFAAPSAVSQTHVMQQTLAGREVNLVEPQAAGTPAGDVAEAFSLSQVVRQRTPLVIASVKSLIGHTELAGGGFVMLAALLAMQTQTILRRAHFHELNSDISPLQLEGFQACFPLEEVRSTQCTSLVNAFGVTGTNASLMIDSVVPPHYIPKHGPHRIVLIVSAHQRKSLKPQLVAFQEWAKVHADTLISMAGKQPPSQFSWRIFVESDHFFELAVGDESSDGQFHKVARSRENPSLAVICTSIARRKSRCTWSSLRLAARVGFPSLNSLVGDLRELLSFNLSPVFVKGRTMGAVAVYAVLESTEVVLQWIVSGLSGIVPHFAAPYILQPGESATKGLLCAIVGASGRLSEQSCRAFQKSHISSLLLPHIQPAVKTHFSLLPTFQFYSPPMPDQAEK